MVSINNTWFSYYVLFYNMNDAIAKAMASKIAFDAKKHRKNQEKYNYIKSDDDKE